MCWTYPFSKLLTRWFSGMKDEEVMAPDEAELANMTALPLPGCKPRSVMGMGTISAVTGIDCLARRLWRLPEVMILLGPWKYRNFYEDFDHKICQKFEMLWNFFWFVSNFSFYHISFTFSWTFPFSWILDFHGFWSECPEFQKFPIFLITVSVVFKLFPDFTNWFKIERDIFPKILQIFGI